MKERGKEEAACDSCLGSGYWKKLADEQRKKNTKLYT